MYVHSVHYNKGIFKQNLDKKNSEYQGKRFIDKNN